MLPLRGSLPLPLSRARGFLTLRRRQPLERFGQVGLQVVEIFQAGMEAQLYAGLPAALGAGGQVEARDDQRFEAAPAPAHPEQAHPLDHRGDGGPRIGFQQNAEQAAAAGEIALPEFVAAIAGQGGVLHR